MLNDDIRKFQEALKIIKEEDRESKALILSQREEIKKLQEQIKLQPIKE